MVVLQIIFGEDEHTAADGPYNRLLKARKWLYILCIFATFQYYSLINYNELALILKKVIKFDEWIVNISILLAILLLALQYLMLLLQTSSAYRAILSDRLNANFETKVEKLKENISTSQKKFDECESLLQNNPSNDPERLKSQREESELARVRLGMAHNQLTRFVQNSPAMNPVFIGSEIAIDFLRVIPPMIFSIAALIHILSKLLSI